MNNVTIDLDKINEIALKGIRRTTVFLGLGVNAARDEAFNKYQLPENHYLKLVPDNATAEQIARFKENFEKWIVSNGLREIIETFGVFLDKIHHASLLLATNKGRITQQDAETFGPAFERKGIEEKLKTLRTRFNILTDKEKYFPSINQTRNCITHRQGQIGTEDLKGNASLNLVWWTLEIIAQTADGITPIPKEGFYFEHGGVVSLKVSERRRDFTLSEFIELTPGDINEICFLVYLATSEIVASTVNYVKTLGIQVGPITGNKAI